MKVLCIDIGIREPNKSHVKYKLKEGKVYTVLSECEMFSENHQKNLHCYELKVMGGWANAADLFIPISNFDQKLIVCLKKKPLRRKVQKELSKNKYNG